MRNVYLVLVLLLLLAQPAHALNTKAAGMGETTPGAAMTGEGGKNVSPEPDMFAAPAAQSPQAAAPAQGAAPAKAAGCADDERLLTIGQWLGVQSQHPPVTISPETFILMDQEVVALLGGQAVVCPNVPLLKGGKALSKITVPFDLLWNQLQTAAIRGDAKAVTRLQGSFKAAALPPDKVVELAAATGLNEAAVRTLFNGLGLNPRNQHEFYTYFIEIYVAVGGKSTEKAQVLMEFGSTREFMEKMPPKSFLVVPSERDNTGGNRAIAAALSKAGLVTGDARTFGLR